MNTADLRNGDYMGRIAIAGAFFLAAFPMHVLADKPSVPEPVHNKACEAVKDPLTKDEAQILAEREIARREGKRDFSELNVDWREDDCAWLVTAKLLPERVGGQRTVLISTSRQILMYMPGM
jgi:hypothetical protein